MDGDLSAYLNAVSTLRDIAEGADDVIMCLTSATDGTVLWASRPGLTTILGYAPHDVVGQVGLSMSTGTSDDGRFQDTLAVVRTGATAAARYEARHKSGHRVPLRVTKWRLWDNVAVGLAVRDGLGVAPELRTRAGRVPTT